MAYDLWPSFNTTLEVKEPLSIVDYPSRFSLFPREISMFNVTVENSAPINYSVVLDFRLNDSEYQTRFVSFSNTVYTVIHGQQKLNASIAVDADAPATMVTLSVDLVRLGTGGEKTSNGLVGYWKFDEGSGTIAHDSNGNDNNGVLIGDPGWTTGKSGNALSFDGISYVDCGNAAILHVQSCTLAV